ncbi:MAG: SET domain-containing protein-lysine N-methyltransferase [Bacteroidetes bacterium]|nr:SET domain-containing protein-lysine N-methyltransferase [Bacteroidota bacterium]
MSYSQVTNTPFIHEPDNLCASFGGNMSTRILDGFLLTEHEKHIYDVFEPTSQALALPVNDRVRKLEKYLATLDQVDVTVEHEFIDGLYKRTMRVPAGTVLTGAIHKVKHMDVMTKGSMIVVTENGTKEINAPFTMTTQTGVKKCGIAVSDVEWCTFHAAPYNTIEEMEAHIHSENDADLFIEGEVDDYAMLMNELNITDELVLRQTLTSENILNMPENEQHIYKDKSQINGQGLFTRKDIPNGAIICHARLNGDRTIAGRFANHSSTPNAVPLLQGDNIVYKALKSINSGSEITINYRDSISINPNILKV